MYKGRNGNQRLKLHIADHSVILVTDGLQCLRCLKGGKGRKQSFGATIGIACADIVLNTFCFTRHRIIHMAIKNLVKLKNIIRCQRDDIETFVDDIQHITVTGNLLLVTVSRCGFITHQLTDTGAGGNDSLNGIGRLGALYLCNLNELFKFFRTLFQIQFLLTCLLVYGSNQAKQLGIPFIFTYFGIIKSSHSIASI